MYLLCTKLIFFQRPIIREGAKSVPKDKADALVEAYKTLEIFLKEQDYVAGNKLTIADLVLAATISSTNVLVPIAENRFPDISAWLGRIRELPYYAEANQKGLDKFAAFLKSKLAQNNILNMVYQWFKYYLFYDARYKHCQNMQVEEIIF